MDGGGEGHAYAQAAVEPWLPLLSYDDAREEARRRPVFAVCLFGERVLLLRQAC